MRWTDSTDKFNRVEKWEVLRPTGQMSERMGSQFCCEKIEVEADRGEPRALVWRGKRYEVKEILKAWHDFGFPLGIRPRAAGWRVRHKREYFKVLTTDGRQLELYHDRGKKKREWVLSERVG